MYVAYNATLVNDMGFDSCQIAHINVFLSTCRSRYNFNHSINYVNYVTPPWKIITEKQNMKSNTKTSYFLWKTG